MKTYDFSTIIDRTKSHSLKWEKYNGKDILPFWVADMDFRTSPEIIEALKSRVEHGIYGYATIPDEWNQAYVSWWKTRYHIDLIADRLVFCTGVVPAISSIIRKITTPNENVLIQTPVPGGVGLLTRLSLLENLMEAYKNGI